MGHPRQEERLANEADRLAAGTVVEGRYRLEGEIGRGGVGVVMSATHVQLGHRVAIKFLHPDPDDQRNVTRLVREARALVTLRSEHATRVFDVGAFEAASTHYLVMEYLEGIDLAHLLAQRTRLPFTEAASYILQACDALSEAHALGIIHRDIKPSNLFLTRLRDGSPCIKLMDFGLSKAPKATEEEGLTTSSDSLGTPHYMSPEQIVSTKDVDARTDVWALGVTLFRLVTGEHMFRAQTAPGIYVAIMGDPLRSACGSVPDVPAGLDDLLRRTLDRNLESRIPTVEAFARELSALVSPGVRSTPMPAPAITASEEPPRTAPEATRALEKNGVPRFALAIATIALGCVTALVWKITSHSKGSPETAAMAMTVASSEAPPASSSEANAPETSPPMQIGPVSRAMGSNLPPIRPSSRAPTPRAASPARTAASSHVDRPDPYGQRR